MLTATAVQESPWISQPLRVPREDNKLLARPSLADALDSARENCTALSAANIPVQGRTLDVLREWTRRDALEAARKYTLELLGKSIDLEPADLLFVAGHQPTLFHPGVWAKNFAIGEMAARAGGAALNLIVDNDVSNTSRIRVPAGSPTQPFVESLAFDDDRPAGPWEETVVANQELFRSFGGRLADKMAHWKIAPIGAAVWPEAIRQLERSPLLRDTLTVTRCRLERQWGTANLELPISRLCELEPFLWFASHLIAQLPRFHDVYNQVLGEYRRVYRVRSSTHPVPELKDIGGWLEAPFWVWRKGDRQRGRLLVQRDGKQVRLSDGREVFATLPLPENGDACCAVEVLRTLPEQGIRLRTRALTTTLFARLFLADLFVHGIGGSKYDEMTDRIIMRFFKIAAPAFQTLSASLHLPLGKPFDVEPQDERRLLSLLRDLEFSPERHLHAGDNPALDGLLTEKATLVAQQQEIWNSAPAPRSVRRSRSRTNYERHQKLASLSQQLTEFTGDQRRQIEEELATTRQQLAANAILRDREFSFALFPEEKLRDFMTGLGNRSVE